MQLEAANTLGSEGLADVRIRPPMAIRMLMMTPGQHAISHVTR
jgi:hypothetical protein